MKELELLQQLQDKIIATTQELVRIDTVEAPAVGDAPFGLGNKKCLELALRRCEELGFTTYNCDNYAGHADFGEGDEIFGILGHLDVVPANEKTWIVPPFSAEIIDGKIYGRGTTDDKSAMVACMYAVKALADAGYTFKRKVRLIFGCNEETGSLCMKHYFQKVEEPNFSFSPDADFPLINREKGNLGLVFNLGKLPKEILDFYSGLRKNVVPDECLVKIEASAADRICQCVERETKDGYVELLTRGKSAHGSMPSNGDNAIWKMLKALYKAFPDNKGLDFAVNKMCDYTGKKWGVNLQDEESGDLTCNIGVARMEEGDLILTVDCRHPVTYTCQQVIDVFAKNSEEVKMTVTSSSEPLFVPEDSYLVQTLLGAYAKVTGEKPYAMAIGGGTYSRTLSNCVAFGPEFLNDSSNIHQPNEFVKIENLMKVAKIYMQTIKDFCCE